MTHLSGKERSRFVREMFAQIALTYDKFNRMMTFRQDLKWRKEAADSLDLNPKATILDIGSGTGDMLLAVIKAYPESTVIGIDFTPEMIQLGCTRKDLEKALWVIADANHLPFSHSSFNGTISAFLMRNLPEVDPVLKEQHRILSEDGKMVCLETTPPKKKPLNLLPKLFLNFVIPFLDRLVLRDLKAYSYLAISTSEFIQPEDLAKKMDAAGYCNIQFVRRMIGAIAIHKATKA